MSARIAFLGMGAMGSRMVARLLQAGHQVSVWNRSTATAERVAGTGAKHAFSPCEAAEGADFVISMVRDDDASYHVWCDSTQGAFGAMKPGAVAIESSTLSLNAIDRLHAAALAANVSLLDAPVSGSRPAAEAGQLVFLVGGSAEVLEHAKPILMAMGSSVEHVGAAGYGALAKLVTNTLLGVHVTALAELIGLLHRRGVKPHSVLKAVSTTPIWAPVDHYLSGSMLSGDFTAQFPIELIAKDFGYAVNAAGGSAHMPVASVSLEVFQHACSKALGAANMTAVAQLYGSGQVTG